jgi:transcriptional regulator with XRE-family HTH domain
MYASTALQVHEVPVMPADAHRSFAQELSPAGERTPIRRNYLPEVATTDSSAVRLAAFSAFVRRACDRAKLQQGWSVERIAELAGMSSNTIYLWIANKMKRDPLGESVAAFCNALGIPPAVPFAILWPGAEQRPTAPEPFGAEPDLLAVARRLADPATPEATKHFIRETVRYLTIYSPSEKDSQRQRRNGPEATEGVG